MFAGGQRASRDLIQATDLFDPDLGELARTHLEEAEIPGIAGTQDGDGAVIVCVTTPRVIHDIRTVAGNGWLDIQKYVGQTANSQAKLVCGLEFVMFAQTAWFSATTALSSNRQLYPLRPLWVRVLPQPLTAFTRLVKPLPFVPFLVPMLRTSQLVILSQSQANPINGGAGNAPLETDGEQETRRIVAKTGGVAGSLTFDKPLMKPHLSGDLVTLGITIHNSVFIGGPSVVMGVAERPIPIIPPKYDDMQMINRIGWRGFLKFQMFRPEFIEVHQTAGSTD